MEEPYYTYEEEEQSTQRRKSPLGIILGFIVGLIVGGGSGFILGNQSTDGLETFVQLSNPNTPPYIVMILIFIFLFATIYLKITGRIQGKLANVSREQMAPKMLILTVIGLLVLFLAGIFLFVAQ